MQYDKKEISLISEKVRKNRRLSPEEINTLLEFNKPEEESTVAHWLKRVAVPASLALGFFFSAFPKEFEIWTASLPQWTNLNTTLLTGVNYLWDLIGDPVTGANIVYHIPNIVLYSFGFFGIKKLIEFMERHTWLDKALAAQEIVKDQIASGNLNLALDKGASLLFVGKGDFIGMQFCLDHLETETVTISESKPAYTEIWNQYAVDTLYKDLKNVISRSDGASAGEYVFFPVKDDQIFLPNEKAYDLSPHKLDILVQDIRVIEKESKWKPKRILIIGDRFHKSFVQSEDRTSVIDQSEDIISLESIAAKYQNVSLIDPTDIVLKKILAIAKGRKIVFRATKDGIKEYKQRFYERLSLLGYQENTNSEGVLTIGYDLFEDQTEQQTLSRKIDDYFPVVLSKNVRDALLRNGYKTREFLYVPELVLNTLKKEAKKQ